MGPLGKFHSAAHLDDKKNDPKRRKGRKGGSRDIFQGFIYLAGVSFFEFFLRSFWGMESFFS